MHSPRLRACDWIVRRLALRTRTSRCEDVRLLSIPHYHINAIISTESQSSLSQ